MKKALGFFLLRRKKRDQNKVPVNISSIMGQIIKGLSQVFLWCSVAKGFEPELQLQTSKFPWSINLCPQNHKPPSGPNTLMLHENSQKGPPESPLLEGHRKEIRDYD